jgi:hypothetical protein
MTFVRREGNHAAHTLAKLGTTICMDQQWLYESPPCIHEIVSVELAALST